MALPPSNVVVVGGGIVGSSIAWHLSQQTNVTIIAEQVGGFATPNSFAWINAAYGNEKFYWDFRFRSMDRWRQIHQEIPGLPIYWNGSLEWDMEPEELDEAHTQLTSWGYDMVKVNRTQIAEIEPALSDSMLPDLALYGREEGQMEAHVVAKELIADAQTRFGAELLEHAVAGFIKEDGKVKGVYTGTGQEILADHVVIAAGLGSVQLLASENVTLPLTGKAGLLVNSTPLVKKMVTGVVYATGIHVRQTADGRIRSGKDETGSELGDDPQTTAESFFENTVKKSFKDGEDLKLDYFTIGYRPRPEDGIPILGDTGLDGVTVAVMHSGVSNAALVGQLISEKVLSGEEDPILADFHLSRFSNATRKH